MARVLVRSNLTVFDIVDTLLLIGSVTLFKRYMYAHDLVGVLLPGKNKNQSNLQSKSAKHLQKPSFNY